MAERSSKSAMGLPANSSTVALMRKSDKQSGGLEVEFRGGERSSHATTGQYITVAILFYVNLINYMDRMTIAGIIDDVRHEFQGNNAMMGLLQTAFVIAYMIFAPLFGYLGDRYSRRAIMATGVFCWCVFTLAGSFVNGNPETAKKVEGEELKHDWGNAGYWQFLACRAMVGIGEASYSTIAPTIISDMFVKNMRSRMLAVFYFAIPVGSGLGYIVGSESAKAAGEWHWALRVTPAAGVLAVLLILLVMIDPPRGESEGHQDLAAQTYKEDIISLAKNKSFVFSTLGFTCVTFCLGALAWFGPDFIKSGLLTKKEEDREIAVENVELVFGIVTMMSGIVGVPLGMVLSTRLKVKYPRADPLICAVGVVLSTIFLSIGMFLTDKSIYAMFTMLFIGEVTLNLNWSIIADILLYIVPPNTRSTAEALQILASHAFGDAGSPYLIGLISDTMFSQFENSPDSCMISDSEDCVKMEVNRYHSLLYSLFTNIGVEFIGGIFFFITAIYIVKDKLLCETAAAEAKRQHHDGSGQRLMMTPTNYSPEDSLAEDFPSDQEMPKLKLFITDDISSSRSPSPP